MSLTTALAALRAARGSFVSAIREKGVEITDSATLHECASAVSLIPQGGEGGFYECASVSGPYTETYYAVSGAGMSAVNGNYTDTGTTWKSSPVYSNTASSTTYYMVHDAEYDVWFILDYIPGESDNPLPSCLYYKESFSEQWYIQEGADPVPTVTLTTVTHDLPKTWTGNKAVFDSSTGIWGYELTATTGLTWDIVKPVVGRIYTTDAMIEIANLFTGIPTDYVLYHPLSSAEASVGGYSCTYTNVTFAQDSTLGETVAVFNGDGILTISNVAGSAAIAFSIFQKIAANTTESSTVVMRDRFGILSRSGATGVFDFNSNLELEKQFDNSGWKHIYTDYANGATRLFIGGEQVETDTSFKYNFDSSSDVQMGVHFNGSSFPLTGKLKAFRMYDRQLSTAEIAALANEFTS